MKYLLPLFSALVFLQGAAAENTDSPSWVAEYDTLLQKYVEGNGVAYRKWYTNGADVKSLNKVVSEIGNASLTGMSKEARLAFYINAYNANIIHRVLKHYPVKSIKNTAFLVFRRGSFKVAGKSTTYHKLENGIIRKQFKEPRIHFALNCASVSCPPLHNRAFTEANLEESLEQLTRAFLDGSNRLGVYTGNNRKRVYVSKIFDWYAEDFGGKANILTYINRYREDRFTARSKVVFQDYDWDLNEAK